MIIKGHRHLQECAYIGDDSSEEEDELQEIEEEKLALLVRDRESFLLHINSISLTNPIVVQNGRTPAPTNRVDMLKKHRPEIEFENDLEQNKSSKFTHIQDQAHQEDTDMKTAKEMREILNKISMKREHIRAKGARGMVEEDTVVKVGVPQAEQTPNHHHHPHHKTVDNQHKHRNMEIGKAGTDQIKMGKSDEEVDPPLSQSSHEILKSVLKKLQKLGPRGKKILEDLKRETLQSSEQQTPEEEDHLATLTLSPIAGNAFQSTTSNPVSEDRIARVLRRRRDAILRTALSVELNGDDEDENLAQEEGFVPDGHADHHKVVNETTLNDRSNSEIWSSFSSSEEALLECPGLIMSLPLTASMNCVRENNDTQLREDFSPNTITFT